MRIILPPSETKRTGGREGTALNWERLSLPELTPIRRAIADNLLALGSDPTRAAATLGLGPKNLEYLEDNLSLLRSATLPALVRYTGVLFDALDYASLPATAQARAGEDIWIFSALFGPIRADDPIPRYRLSWDTKIPGESLKARWRSQADQMWGNEFTIDLRSEGYRDLTPLGEDRGIFVKFVRDASGALAMGHANKATKGSLVRELLVESVAATTAEEFVQWAREAGWAAFRSPSHSAEVIVVSAP